MFGVDNCGSCSTTASPQPCLAPRSPKFCFSSRLVSPCRLIQDGYVSLSSTTSGFVDVGGRQTTTLGRQNLTDATSISHSTTSPMVKESPSDVSLSSTTSGFVDVGGRQTTTLGRQNLTDATSISHSTTSPMVKESPSDITVSHRHDVVTSAVTPGKGAVLQLSRGVSLTSKLSLLNKIVLLLVVSLAVLVPVGVVVLYYVAACRTVSYSVKTREEGNICDSSVEEYHTDDSGYDETKKHDRRIKRMKMVKLRPREKRTSIEADS
ncbi:hypothetical protein NP493_1788g00008 [Ridgeia piscesae]|uniref:Uncharacterized protein n=1 Tax=Ridgeia piscesae TaxID=27915 RepID=A0AAD9JU06_RIDPI|nr:hypothetical protein NP493_1788g00008 [Ridgeia piscesae]